MNIKKQPSANVLELLAKARAAKEAREREQNTAIEDTKKPLSQEIENILDGKEENTSVTNQYGQTITYNDKQQLAIDTILKGENCILLGAAGTGKTTTTKGAVLSLIQNGKLPIFPDTVSHKHLEGGMNGIVLCAYTRRAVQNIKKAMPEDLKGNCMTIHKLLEYAPIYYEVYDDENDKMKKTMRFEATRNAFNALPKEIHTIIIDEASMVSLELYAEIITACTHKVQIILIGDIQQLPPVFGSAILGYKMLEWPVVELTEVYRQALESPIIRLAHHILSGESISHAAYTDWHIPGKLKIHPWKKKLHPDVALLTAAKFLTTAIAQGDYDPINDVILIPFNKAFGTDELNKHIGNYLARASKRDTYEVIAGFTKLYFTVGDKVLYEKEDAEIVAISSNPTYVGKSYKPASPTLDYWGHEQDSSTSHKDLMNAEIDDIDDYLEALANASEDRTKESSHLITVRLLNTDEEIVISRSAEVNSLILAYALTVHKSQGSEWRKVFLLLHTSHNTMLQRELLYTACTRAKEELYIICEPESMEKGILNQRIKGNTLEEKAIFFQGKVDRKEMQTSAEIISEILS